MLRGVKHASMRMNASDNEENLKYEKKKRERVFNTMRVQIIQ